MTMRIALLCGFLLAAAAWPPAAEAQRARVRSEGAEDTNRTAVARPAAEAPAPAAPAPAPAAPAAAETRTARERQPTPVVVSPTVTTPTNVGGSFSVGKPVVVGNTFTVGGSRDEDDKTDDRDRRRDRRRDRDDAVIVPVYVPVIVNGIEVSTEPTYLESEPLPSTRAAGAHRIGPQFTPWFQVGLGLMAGVPTPLPSPERFEERNVSASVTEFRGSSSAGDAASVRAYAPGTGGISFDLVPPEASIFVDGAFVGSAEDFAPGREPLLLRFGAYVFELRATGYRAETFRLDVPLGEVLPIAGALEKTAP